MNVKEAKLLTAAMAEVKSTWRAACKEAGVPDSASFVIFSVSNESAKLHNEATGRLFDLQKKIRKNSARRAKHNAYVSCGLTRVRGANGGVFYE